MDETIGGVVYVGGLFFATPNNGEAVIPSGIPIYRLTVYFAIDGYVITIRKGVIFYHSNAIGDEDAFEGIAGIKCRVTYVGDGTGNNYFR